MSPTPIIDLQRRLTLVGAIRIGGEKPERGVGKKLDAFRLTSPRRQLVEQAAELYGGSVSAWRSPVGEEWQVYTETPELPVLVMPGYSLRQSYELWEGATKRTRLCDGVDEELTGGPCICAGEGVDRCDIYTRFVVALPELDTVLGWRLITRGANAAHELPTMLAFVEAHGRGATFVAARMRIDERRGVKDGQVVRFVVPTLDLGIGYAALAATPERPALAAAPEPSEPDSFVPTTRRDPSYEQALDTVTGPAAARRSSLPPIGADFHDDEPNVPIPVPDEHESYTEKRQTLASTDPQRSKLNVLVGQLRDAGHITTRSLWQAIAGLRGVDEVALIDHLGGVDTFGDLHWSPLRDALTRPEANQLIDWLEVKEQRVRQGVPQ